MSILNLDFFYLYISRRSFGKKHNAPPKILVGPGISVRGSVAAGTKSEEGVRHECRAKRTGVAGTGGVMAQCVRDPGSQGCATSSGRMVTEKSSIRRIDDLPGYPQIPSGKYVLLKRLSG